ncbi:MAG: chitobiase/beta-hexosaminidase C-terminal domain-containing protein [Eubacteriales bacterium]|nr:chitobiase/beta-hexosaminidase C-terminal domain-containing protein [Eubacteriales bacterium]
MREQSRFWRKLHRGPAKAGRKLAGTICLFLTAALLLSLWSGGFLRARALGNVITFQEGDPVWVVRSDDDGERYQITAMEKFEISQTVETGNITLRTNGQEKELTLPEGELGGTLEAAYVEDATLSVETIKVSTSLELGNPQNKYEVAVKADIKGRERAIEDLTIYFPGSDNTTYYCLVTDQDAENSFSDFEKSVREQYAPQEDEYTVVSENALITTDDAAGRAFHDTIETYMEKKGAKEYRAGEEIPLYDGENFVVRIDMLTVSEQEFQIHGWNYYLWEELAGDYDLALYTSYSYELTNTAQTTEAPEPVLESGRSIDSEDGVPEADALTGLSMAAPDDLTEEELEAYTKAYENGTLEYILSDEPVTSFREAEWKEWEDSQDPIPLDGNRYLYTRVRPSQPEDDPETGSESTLYLISDPEEYEIRYITEAPEDLEVSLLGQTMLEGSAVSDQVLIGGAADGARIFYTADGSEISLTKVDPTTKALLDRRVPLDERGVEYYKMGDTAYARVDGLWYACENGILYEGAFTPAYDTNGGLKIRTWVVEDGKALRKGVEKEYLRLNIPRIRLESGSDLTSETVETVSDDRITAVIVSNPYEDTTQGLGAAYEAAIETGTIEYFWSDTEVSEADLNRQTWTEFSGDALPMSMEDEYLYVRLCPSGEDAGEYPAEMFVESAVREYHFTYKDETAGPLSVTSSAETGSEVQGDGMTVSASVTLTALTDAEETQARILYTVDGGELSLSRVDDEALRERLSASASESGSVPTTAVDEGNLYVRVNGIWYGCGAADTTMVYEGPFALDPEKLAAEDGVTVKALALADGYAVSAAQEFKFQGLRAPEIQFESGRKVPVSYDDMLTDLVLDDAYKGTGATRQYLLSNRELSSVPDNYWVDWDGTAVSPERFKYLYTRVTVPDGSGFVGSAVRRHDLTYITESPGSVTATAYVDGQPVDGNAVDFGDQIELVELESSGTGESGEKALIFYTLDGSWPSFTKVDASGRDPLDERYSEETAGTVTYEDTLYVRVNGLWYECGDGTMLYDEETKIEVDESIYVSSYLTINAQAIVNGRVIGKANQFSYAFNLRDQVEAPTASKASGETIRMGDLINLSGGTINSRIFYTLNGSAPVVTIVEKEGGGNEIELGEGTEEFTLEPIMIQEPVASYGNTVTITAVACMFREYSGGRIARTMRDSSLATFTYTVENQAVVEPVRSTPATSAQERAVVRVGSRIHLYTATEGAEIFYTMDGTEPAFDEDTLEPANESTMKYSARQEIVVPEITDSSVITITAVAYKTGLASSDISRLVFRYPEAVTAPYATPAAGSVTENTSVELKTSTSGAVIYYEVAYGSSVPADPTEDSSVFDSSNPFTITRRTTIKAFAVKDGMKSAVATFTYEVSEKLDVPEPSIETGSVVASGTVIELDADEHATIYYTVDGSDPKKSDNKNVLIGDSVIISGSAGTVVTVRTYAARTGYSDSDIGYYSYSISTYDGGIYADKETGSTVRNGEVIHLNTDVSDAVIRYTTDGSTPTVSSTSGSAVTINGEPGENVILKAIAVSEGTDRAVSAATFTYTIMDKLAAPTSSVPDGAVFTAEGAVTLTAESGRIYYTTNGDDPTTASSLYKNSIVVDQAVTIKAITVGDDQEQSDVAVFTYGFADQVETPQASYASGELEVGTEIAFLCGTEGASIYYRTDGTDPDPQDTDKTTLYTGPVRVDKAVTFKVIAVKDHMQDSRVLTVGYTVREPEIAAVPEEEESQLQDSGGGRLQSRRSFSDSASGPTYSDVVLKNASYGVVVSSNEGVLPDDVQLNVEQVQVTDSAQRTVKQAVSESYAVVAGYEVTLLSNGEEIQPDGEIEIGLPIPAEYENSIIQVVYLDEDGSARLYETRRSGGVAYTTVDHLSTYAIAAPVEYEEESGGFPWLPVLYSAAVLLTALGLWLLYRSRKRKEEGEKEHV